MSRDMRQHAGGQVPERFDEIIATVVHGGKPQIHEVVPADFGSFSGRRAMFLRCLEVVTRRYPDIGVSITGDRAALIDMGLMPNGDILVDGRLLRTLVGPTLQPGTVRLTFTRR